MTLILALAAERNWIINRKNPLRSKYRWEDTKEIISFIYCPGTREFNLGIAKRHKELAQEFNTPLAQFVRGIYLKDEARAILRAYAIDDLDNFNAQYDTVEALNLHRCKVKFNASSEELYYQHDWK